MEQKLLDKKHELNRKILTLEWDKKHHNINFSKQKKLEHYKKELEEVENQLKQNDK
jgi:hypothetical protein